MDKAKRSMATSDKQLVLAIFRLATLSLVLIELAFDPPDAFLLSVNTISVLAVAYTAFKIVHPLHWYLSYRSGTVIVLVDVAVSAGLLLMHRVMHSPFPLYALNPVLTSALLLPAGTTWVVAGVTAAYYTVNFFSFSLSSSMEFISGSYIPYVLAVGLLAWLPYRVINPRVLQSIWSTAVSEERLKLGREIHDGLSQTIYGLRLELQMLNRDITPAQHLEERLASLQELMDKAEAEVRGSIELLRSFTVSRPFLAQIEASLRHLKSESGIDYRLDADGGEPVLDDLVKLEVLHVCEEALMNVAKHSRARQVTVKVCTLNGKLQTSISDDGQGISKDRLDGGYGLTIMKERIESLGGNFLLASSSGSGTEVRIEVPQKWQQYETIR